MKLKQMLNKQVTLSGKSGYKWMCQLWLLLIILVGLTGCSTSRKTAKSNGDAVYLSSKVKLSIPHKDAVFTVNGTMRLQCKERVQLSFLMPVFRSEVARVEVTPEEVLLIDRMGKRYVRMTRDELNGLLPKKTDFMHLEKLLMKASLSHGKRVLDGKDLGIPKFEKCRIELTDFSNKPFTLNPTQLSSKYQKVEPEELLQLISDLLQ